MKISYAALTDVGLVRRDNEDTYLVLDLTTGASHIPGPRSAEGEVGAASPGALFAVADGMGGALAGEVASSMAVHELSKSRDVLVAAKTADEAKGHVVRAIKRANELINSQSETNPEQRGMGTTLTAALLRDGRVYFFQVGDSRGFLLRQGKLKAMTKDHSLIGQLVHDKLISAEDAEQIEGGRNIILKALGAEATVDVDISEAVLDEGDMVVLCSDGLHGCVKNPELESMVGNASDNASLCDDLVQAAKDAGGPDNITVVSLSIPEWSRPRAPGLVGRIAGFLGRIFGGASR